MLGMGSFSSVGGGALVGRVLVLENLKAPDF